MRFVSLSPAFKRTVRHAKSALVTTVNGATAPVETERSVIALFKQGGCTASEKALALDRFKFTGLSEREDPSRRLSVYDTDEEAHSQGWSPELKAEIEANLIAGQGQYYFAVTAPETVAPWPSYDETEADEILRTASLIGVDLNHVLAYERENLNRPEVIEALEQPTAGVEVTA